MAQVLGGRVGPMEAPEFGKTQMAFFEKSTLFDGVPDSVV